MDSDLVVHLFRKLGSRKTVPGLLQGICRMVVRLCWQFVQCLLILLPGVPTLSI
jgi:hypothetical protein